MAVVVDPQIDTRVEMSTQDLLQRCERVLNRFAPLLAVIILFGFALWAWLGSRGHRLQFDELLEISAAGAATNQEVLSLLAAGVDFNPPLSHFLIRMSTSLLGNTEWAMRLPAVLGVAVLLVCLYLLVSRRITPGYGLAAMLLLLCMPVRNYAIQARPYGVVLGLTGITILLYQAVSERRSRTLALVGIAVSTAALTASHYYAVMVAGVLIVVEILRAWRTKQPDYVLFACCAVPPAAVVFFLRGAIREQRHQLTHYFARGNLFSFDHGYDEMTVDPLVCGVAVILVTAAILFYWRLRPVVGIAPAGRNFTITEVYLGIALLALPICGAFLTQFVTHAYVPRYFLPATVGLVICGCFAVDYLSAIVPGLILLLVLSLSLGFGKSILQEAGRPIEILPSISVLMAEPGPLIFDSPANYAQIYHYYPELRSNVWVIADPQASMRYRHYDTDDKIMLALAEHGKAQALTLRSAVRKWNHFHLVPRSADYIYALKCVMDSGAQIQVRHPFGNSNFIFDVDVNPTSIAEIDACTSTASPGI